MITIDSLTVRYGSVTALDGITMHLTERAVHGVVGAGGAGKSSLLATIYGLVIPESGSITRSGHPLPRRGMAYLEAEPHFYDGLTGRDLLDLTARFHPSSDPESFVRRFGLPVDRPIAAWPAAVRKMLALSVVMMQRKPLLLLDEPFDGLDAAQCRAVRELLAQCRDEGATVLVTSQRPATLATLCDDIRLLDNGRITAEYRRGEYAGATAAWGKTEALEELLRQNGPAPFDKGKIN